MIQLVNKDGSLTLSQKMMKGDDGGYYIPSIDETTGIITWIPSEEGMEAIEGTNIKGPKGDTGVYIGSEPPVDEDIAVWVNPEGEATAELATKAYVDEKIAGIEAGNVDLTGYATEKYVDDAITAIELTPGPAGKDGKDGEDYVLTEEDKAEIAGMVPGADVDLSDYYTKEEIDGLLANLPAGDIPSGEGVKF